MPPPTMTGRTRGHSHTDPRTPAAGAGSGSLHGAAPSAAAARAEVLPGRGAGLAGRLVGPGSLGDYAYYAPLGAISVIYPAVTDSLQEAARAMVAIALGIAVAMTLQWVAWPNALTVGLVVAAGIALGGWAWLGEQRTWVPVVGLFVLVLGGAQTETYAAGYLGQIALGAVLGLAVNVAVLPPLSLYDVRRTVGQVRVRVADELRSMADLLEQSRSQETAPDARDWRRELEELESLARADACCRSSGRPRRPEEPAVAALGGHAGVGPADAAVPGAGGAHGRGGGPGHVGGAPSSPGTVHRAAPARSSTACASWRRSWSPRRSRAPSRPAARRRWIA